MNSACWCLKQFKWKSARRDANTARWP